MRIEGQLDPLTYAVATTRLLFAGNIADVAGYIVAAVPELLDGSLDVYGVPEADGGAQDVEAADPVRLVLVGAVSHLTEAVKERRIARACPGT